MTVSDDTRFSKMSLDDPLEPLTRLRLHVDNLSDQLKALQSSRAELGTAIDAYHAFDVERERGWPKDFYRDERGFQADRGADRRNGADRAPLT